MKNWKIKDNKLHKVFIFNNFIEAISFINSIAKIAEGQNHHPDIFNSYNKVIINLITHEKNQITDKDYNLAKMINDLHSYPQ